MINRRPLLAFGSLFVLLVCCVRERPEACIKALIFLIFFFFETEIYLEISFIHTFSILM